VIRPATPDDAPALTALDRAIWSYEHTPTELREQPLETAGVLVDERDGQIVGYTKLAALSPLPSVAHAREIRALAVADGFRRQGVGRGLIAAALEEARRQGATKVTPPGARPQRQGPRAVCVPGLHRRGHPHRPVSPRG
jgi:GNAT superfamily N-acetyltransferase